MKATTFPAVVVLFYLSLSAPARAQTHDPKNEIPIGRCDRLPVVTMKVAGENKQFLLDTGATTILNIKSFSQGESKQIHVESWSGTAATSAREVYLAEVELGAHKLRDLKLPAIDLSPIGKACGGQIDGILGVDLLDQMGMTIDLKRRIAVPAGQPEDSAAAYADMEREMMACTTAFTNANVKVMTECFDPEIILYTPHGEFRGREQVMSYLTDRYFKYAPKLRYDMKPHDIRVFGDALWYSYDYEIATPMEHFAGHGMSMCRRDASGHWRILNMHNSLRELAARPDSVH